MAVRVNTKFVVILSAVLLFMCAGVILLAMFANRANPAARIAEGERYLASNQYEEAAKSFERAVGAKSESTNIALIERWLDTLLKVTPSSETKNREHYDMYRRILARLAQLENTDPARQRAFIDEVYRYHKRAGFPAAAVIEATENALVFLPKDDPETQKLRRYRGLPRVTLMARFEPLSEAERQESLEDLQVAYEADPSDWEAALGIVDWHLAEAGRARKENMTGEARTAQDAAEEALAGFLEANPNHPEGLLLALNQRLQRAQRTATTPAELRARLMESAEDVEELLDLAETLPPAELRTTTFLAPLSDRARLLREAGLERVGGVLGRVLEARPDDVDLKLLAANVQTRLENFDEALAMYEEIVEAPDGTVSLAQRRLPVMQLEALSRQVDVALYKRESVEGKEAREQALADAKAYLKKLGEEVPSDFRDQYTLREATVAMVEGDLTVAMARLSDLRRGEMGDNPEVIRKIAQVLRQQGNHGAALNEYLTLERMYPNDALTKASIGEVYLSLNDLENAREYFNLAVELDPENEYYRSRRDVVTIALDRSQGELDDTFAQLVEAREARLAGEYDTARTILDGLIVAAPDDARAYMELIRTEIGAGERARAREVAENALEKFPNSETIRQAAIRLSEDDPVQAALMIVDSNDAISEAERRIGRVQVYREAAAQATDDEERAAYEADAERELAAALEAAPEDPAVVEAAFIAALEASDIERARELREVAARKNLDQLDGLLYQARIEVTEATMATSRETARAKYAAAESSLAAALDRNAYNAQAWRLRGQVQRELGRTQEALESLRRAWEARPNDVSMGREYVFALLSSGRPAEALDAIRAEGGGLLRYAPNDPQLVNLWLDLEARAGDAAFALDRREEIYENNPEYLPNAVALAEMYSERRRWEDVDRVIADLESLPDADRGMIAQLRARSLFAQDRVEDGVQAYESWVASLDEDEIEVMTWIRLGDMLSQANQPSRALAYFDRARQYQDSETLEADRKIGDHHFGRGARLLELEAVTREQGRTAEADEMHQLALDAMASAYEAYKAVDDADADSAETRPVGKRMVESLIRLDRLDEAERKLAELSSEIPEDLEVMLLGVSLAEQRGDIRAARERLARAIQVHTESAEPFFQRALLNRDEPGQMTAVMQDLDQVVKLDPDNIRAWTLRFAILRDNDRIQDGFTELRRGIEKNPSRDEMRLLLVRELMNTGRMDEAAAEVLDVVEARPESLEWKARAAGILSRLNRWAEVESLYARMYETNDTVQIANALLDAKLRIPDRVTQAEVNRLMRRILNDETTEETVATVMLRGRAYSFLDMTQDAEAEFRRGRQMAGDDAAQLNLWLEQLNLALGGGAAVRNYLATKSQLDSPFLIIQKTMFDLMSGEDDFQAKLEQIEGLEDQTDDPLALRELYRLRGRLYYQLGQYSDAVEVLSRAVELGLADIELYNNLAYLLANDLSDPAGALPYAEKAAELAPLNSSVLDTLGWAYYQLGRYEDARRNLTRASATAANDGELIIANIHLGFAHAKLEDMTAAREAYNRALDISIRSPEAGKQYQEDLDRLNSAL